MKLGNELPQLSIDDLLIETSTTSTPALKIKPRTKKIIFSPKELAEQGKKFTAVDEKRWTEVVFELQRRERLKGNWEVNWFTACDLYRKERDEHS